MARAYAAITLTALSLVAAFSTGCGAHPGFGLEENSASLSLTPSSMTLTVGQTAQFTALSGSKPASRCTWQSTNTSALTVDSSGNVTAVAAGAAAIQASCQSGTAVAPVQIAAAAGPSQAGKTNTSYQWTAPAPGSTDSLGTIDIANSSTGKMTLLSPMIHSSLGALRCTSAAWDASGEKLTISYAVAGTVLHVTMAIAQQQGQIAASMAADAPVITSVDMGKWAPGLAARTIAVPYYGSISYLAGAGEFANAWWDWRSTGATALSGTAAQYQPRTDGSLALMHEELVVAASPDIDDVFPFPGNPPSPYMAQMAGRTVLDIWTAGFSAVQQGLELLRDYGIGNCIGIIHNWQHAGYDNALPEHYTANDTLGGDAGLTAAVAAGQADGCLMAVHENYVDYYPNYPQFDPAAISLTSKGDWLNSWKNGLGIQSFSTKPTWMQKNAVNESPVIHQKYATTAAYLDVNSAAPISSHGDLDIHQPNAGALIGWTQANAALWAYERQTHGGPVLGEGANHWFYSGLLDGVEAQLGVGFPLGTDAALPLFVDFDLLRIHPLQVNHGMGYYVRWAKGGNSTLTTQQADAYRMQEIAFGHAPFLDTSNWNDVVHGLIENGLVGPVAASYGAAHASSIQYLADGSWADPSTAARAGQFSTVQIGYDNGLAVAANASQNAVQWNGLTLPQYGWAAVKGKELLAYTAMCGEVICDYAETPTWLFANARNQNDLRIGVAAAQPSVVTVQGGANRALSILYHWQVYGTLPSNYKVFVHFVDDNALTVNEGILFQSDHDPVKPTSQWMPNTAVTDGPWTVQIPSSVADGTYSIRMGLYDPATGGRVKLAGNDDGSDRYIVGYLTLRGGGSVVTFAAVPPPLDDPRLNTAGSIVDFGTIQTDGMVSLQQQNGAWILRSFPRNRPVTILLNSSRFPMPTTVQANGGGSAQVIPLSQGQYWQLPLNGAKSYSWPATVD